MGVVAEFVAQDGDPLLRCEGLPQRQAQRQQATAAHSVHCHARVDVGDDRDRVHAPGTDHGGDVVDERVQLGSVRAPQDRNVRGQPGEPGSQHPGQKQEHRCQHHSGAAPAGQEEPDPRRGEHGGHSVDGERDHLGEDRGGVAPRPQRTAGRHLGEQPFTVPAGQGPLRPLPSSRLLLGPGRVHVPVAGGAPGGEPVVGPYPGPAPRACPGRPFCGVGHRCVLPTPTAPPPEAVLVSAGQGHHTGALP